MTDEILFKYISDQADDSEKRKVQEWSTVSEERKHELSRMKNSWVLASLSNEIDPIIKERAIQLILDKIKTLNRKNNFRDVRIKLMKYAATILLIIGLSVASGYFISVSKFSNSSFTEVIVPNGERSKVILPDGSIVWLNGGSQLKFESAFQSGKRNVVLVGEAFFEVAPNKSHPFLVGTNSKLQVEVLGTSFNVCSYPDDKIITTYLASGKVKIRINGEDDVFLKPSEVLKFEKSSGEMIKQTIGDDRFFDWTRGILNIKGETIEELAKKLERRFDVGILFGDNEVRNHIYSGVIKDENLNTVLEALKFASSLEYEQNGKIITIYSQK